MPLLIYAMHPPGITVRDTVVVLPPVSQSRPPISYRFMSDPARSVKSLDSFCRPVTQNEMAPCARLAEHP
jgi:hypothetical protein